MALRIGCNAVSLLGLAPVLILGTLSVPVIAAQTQDQGQTQRGGGKSLADTVKVRSGDGDGQPQACPVRGKDQAAAEPQNCGDHSAPQRAASGFEAEYSGATGGVVSRQGGADPKKSCDLNSARQATSDAGAKDKPQGRAPSPTITHEYTRVGGKDKPQGVPPASAGQAQPNGREAASFCP